MTITEFFIFCKRIRIPHFFPWFFGPRMDNFEFFRIFRIFFIAFSNFDYKITEFFLFCKKIRIPHFFSDFLVENGQLWNFLKFWEFFQNFESQKVKLILNGYKHHFHTCLYDFKSFWILLRDFAFLFFPLWVAKSFF